MSDSTTHVRSTGVDTLTCSAPWEGGILSFIDLAQYLQREEASHGSKLMPFKRGPYRGAQTKHTGLAFKPGRVLVELRGVTAHDWWIDFCERAEKVSRIDVQVSVEQHPYDHDMALRLYLGERKAAEQRGRPSTFRMQGESDGGSTLYIGDGASRYQGRLYERFYKTHQEDERDTWRYEVQCRRERAQQVADLALRSQDFRPFVQGLVHQHFARRGVVPIFDPSADVAVPPLANPTTDLEKNLRWLGSSVAPSLERHRRWGSYPDALKAMGVRQTLEQP